MNVTSQRPANDHRPATRAIASGRWRSRLGAALLCWTLVAHLGAHSALAFQVDPVEQDAQEYTRLAMEHDSRLLKLNLRRISEAEQAEMPQIRAQGDAIKRKYAPGGPLSKHAAQFEKRLKELSEQVIAPAVKGWVTDAFPEVDQVLAAYPEDAQRMAALQILEQTMMEKVGTSPLPATTAKAERYHAALMKLNPKSSSSYSALLNASDALRRRKQFQFDVLDRFVPVYAVETDNALRKEQYEERLRVQEERIFRGYKGVVLLVLALPLLYLLRGQRSRHSSAFRNPDEAYPFQLPQPLRHIKVLRKAFLVDFDCGLVTDKYTWSETTTTRYYSGGESYVVGNTVQQRGGTWRTSTSTTRYYKYGLRTPDERAIDRQFTSYPSDAEEGHIISTVNCGEKVLHYYNHTLGKALTMSTNVAAINRVYGRLLWMASVAVAFAGFWSVYHFLVKGSEYADDWRFSYMVGSLTLGMAFVSAIWVAIIKVVVQKIRNRQFYKRYLPPLERFVEERTPLLEKHFRAPERRRRQPKGKPSPESA